VEVRGRAAESGLAVAGVNKVVARDSTTSQGEGWGEDGNKGESSKTWGEGVGSSFPMLLR